MTRYLLVKTAEPGHPRHLDLDGFARAAHVHPEFVQRLVSLGLLEPRPDSAGAAWFAAADLATVARIQRLRAGFAINYAALGLVLDLLERVGRLEAAARRPHRPTPLNPHVTAPSVPQGDRKPTWT